MVYIDRNGHVLSNPPFYYRITQLFWGILNFIYAFFVTMLPSLENSGSRSSGHTSGGGGSGRGPPGDGPPRRRMGRIQTLPDTSVPGCGPSGG